MAKLTFKKAFTELKKVIAKTNTKGFADFAFQFVIEGEGAGTFYAKCEGEKLSVEPYNYEDNTATFKASAETFTKLVTGAVAPADAVADGSLVVENNEAGAADIFNAIAGKLPAPKKAAAKKPAAKTAAKKAPAKKAAPKAAKPAAAKKPAAKKPAAKKAAAPKAAPKAEAKPAAPKAEVKPAAPKAEAPAKKTTK